MVCEAVRESETGDLAITHIRCFAAQRACFLLYKVIEDFRVFVLREVGDCFFYVCLWQTLGAQSISYFHATPMGKAEFVTSVSTATIAPELLQIGEDMESSIYRNPR